MIQTNQAGIDVGIITDVDGNIIRKDTQDVSDILDDNRVERDSGDNDRRDRDVRKFASIPVIVLQQLKDQHGLDWNLVGTCPDTTGRFFRWLESNPYFRTSEASLGNGNRYVR